MRIASLAGVTIAVLVAITGQAAGSGSTRPRSGLRGRVVIGPTCPVQRPHENCERPYEASITIRREPAGTVAATVRSRLDGRFTAWLRAGRYLLQPGNGKPYPRAVSQTVTVHAHRFTAVTVHYDSGIR